MAATLADVPLQTRVRGALEVVTSDAGLDIPARYAVVAMAIWPDAIETPGLAPAELPYPQRYPAAVRAAAVAAYEAGAVSHAAVGERFGVPAATVKDWVRRGRTDAEVTA
jgi:hypothetical protein